jgi:hypothetical protein
MRVWRLSRALALPTLLSVLMLGLLAQPSAAETTWSGTCKYDSKADFWPPQKVTFEPSGYYTYGTGHCKGTLNGQPFDGASTYEAYGDMRQQSSCEVGTGQNLGPGYMTFDTGAARAAPTPQRPTPQPVRRSKQHSKQRARHRKKKAAHRTRAARRAAVRAASSDPARDPSQPVPYPPAPSTPNPTLAVWIDQVTAFPNLVFLSFHGAYRGQMVGEAYFEGDPKTLAGCAKDGIPGGVTHGTYYTVTELRG